jgi:hypothetical protein
MPLEAILSPKGLSLFKTTPLEFNPMSVPDSVRFIYIYRGSVQFRGEMRPVRFDSWVRRVDPHQYYQCIDLVTYAIYEVLGSNIFSYYLYNMRPLSKSDPEYIPQLPMQQQTDYNI